MTAGKTDRPAAGHILRYVYLFEEEQRRGRDEGVKERFVVVVGVEGSRYLVAAITTKGEGRKNAVAIPDEIHAQPGSLRAAPLSFRNSTGSPGPGSTSDP